MLRFASRRRDAHWADCESLTLTAISQNNHPSLVTFFFFFFFLIFRDMVSLAFGSCPGTSSCRPGWPRTHRDPPASASRVLGLKACSAAARQPSFPGDVEAFMIVHGQT